MRLFVKTLFNSNVTVKRYFNKYLHYQPDINYLCDKNNFDAIQKTLHKRKSELDLNKLYNLHHQVTQLKLSQGSSSEDKNKLNELQQQLNYEGSCFPNKLHPELLKNDSTEPYLCKKVGEKKDFPFKIHEFIKLADRWDLIRTEWLGHFTGRRSYFLKRDLARLEQALVSYSIDKLVNKGFTPVSVPDILNTDVLESCGVPTNGTITQVYKIREEWGKNLCLSGTAEMSLAALYSSSTLPQEDLPLKLVAASRCFRADDSESKKEQNFYRIYQFTKVEMFVISNPKDSEKLHQEILANQIELFEELGLHFQVLDMPPSDLNNSAYRKYDIEAWMPARGVYGEISSTSNCTDYQSRRLDIKYDTKDGPVFAHTLNGTACAIPRMMISIFETHQNEDSSITIPPVLRKYMNNQEVIPLDKKAKDNFNWQKKATVPKNLKQ